MGAGERSVAAHSEGFPRDPDFPQLANATNPAVMLHMFRTYLKPVAGKTYHILDCKPFRFRCRQSASRYVLQYDLRIAEPDTGREWNQWVTGLLYAAEGKTEELWQEIQEGNGRGKVPERWRAFEPVSFIPDLQMLVEVFPYDRRLPNLSLVMGGEAGHRLEPLLLTRFGPGEWHVEDRAIKPARYRTELGATLEYRIRARESTSSRSETAHCFLKVYRKDHAAEAVQLLESLRERLGDGTRPYSVAMPIAYLGDLGTVALEGAPGHSLNWILGHGVDADSAMRRVARAVAAFNQDDLPLTRRSRLEDQLEDVTSSSALVQWAYPKKRQAVQEITDAVVQGLEEVPAAPIHGDLKPDHIFLSGDDVIFIDLDSTSLGDPVRDPAHLCAYVTGKVGLDSMPTAQARATTAAFVEEYFYHVPRLWREHFHLHCAGALIEVACGIFRHHESGWPKKIAAVIDAAQRACEEVLE